MPQNTIAMVLVNFCTICEVQNAHNAITFKISSDTNSMQCIQQQHQCQQVTQLLPQLLVITAIHRVQQFIAIKLHGGTAC